MRMRRALGPISGLLVMMLPACAPGVPAGVDTISVGSVGTWSAPTFVISGEQTLRSSIFHPGGGQSFGVTNYTLKVTARLNGQNVSSFATTWGGANLIPYGVGTYTSPDQSLLFGRTFVFNDAALPTGTYGALPGTMTITEYTTGTAVDQNTPGDLTTVAPVTKLRATLTLLFPAPIGLVSGTLSIG